MKRYGPGLEVELGKFPMMPDEVRRVLERKGGIERYPETPGKREKREEEEKADETGDNVEVKGELDWVIRSLNVIQSPPTMIPIHPFY